MMCKLKVDYKAQMNKVEGIMMCKLKGGCKRGWMHYDVQIKRALCDG